mmetsp:Transcript_112249/g.341640  ORF Transcript_112249/g.341640 Transcript_112249/m.341640 type:complete len:392 (-) Transcript_112249:191-1366(-)
MHVHSSVKTKSFCCGLRYSRGPASHRLFHIDGVAVLKTILLDCVGARDRHVRIGEAGARRQNAQSAASRVHQDLQSRHPGDLELQGLAPGVPDREAHSPSAHVLHFDYLLAGYLPLQGLLVGLRPGFLFCQPVGLTLCCLRLLPQCCLLSLNLCLQDSPVVCFALELLPLPLLLSTLPVFLSQCLRLLVRICLLPGLLNLPPFLLRQLSLLLGLTFGLQNGLPPGPQLLLVPFLPDLLQLGIEFLLEPLPHHIFHLLQGFLFGQLQLVLRLFEHGLLLRLLGLELHVRLVLGTPLGLDHGPQCRIRIRPRLHPCHFLGLLLRQSLLLCCSLRAPLGLDLRPPGRVRVRDGPLLLSGGPALERTCLLQAALGRHHWRLPARGMAPHHVRLGQ